MDRIHDILNSVNETVANAAKKGPEFVAALPEASKEQLGLNKKSQAQDETEEKSPEMEMEEEMEEMEEYKESFYGMSVGSLKAIASHAIDILNNLDNETVKENLTAAHLQGMIAVAEDHLRSIHDFVMFVEEDDDTEESESAIPPETKKKKKTKRVRIKDLPHYTYVKQMEDELDDETEDDLDEAESVKRPGLWENIRKKKEREGKKYRPAKPGDKDRPDPEQWKKLTK